MSIATDSSSSRRPANNGSDLHQHHPDALDGCSAGRQFRASGNTHGIGAGGLLPLAGVPSLRSTRPGVAESRPLRSVDRPRVDAALFAPAPDGSARCQQRLRNARRSLSAAGSAQDVPAVGQPLPGTSGVPMDVGRGNHHRAARTRGGDERRMAIARQWLAARYNRPGFEDFSTSTCTRFAATAA